MSLYLGDDLISGSKPINLGVRNIGEIVSSSLPLTDAGLHLLDGSLILGGGIYQGFVDYIADLYNDTKVYNPSAFTVVGSPTITDDGIASGFSSSNYITAPNTFLTGDTWKIEAPIPQGQTSLAGFICILTNTCFQLNYDARNKKFYYALSSNNSSWDIANGNFTISGLDLTLNPIMIVEFTGTKYIFNVKQNGTILTGTEITSSSKLYNNSNNLGIGINRGSGYPTDGSIDLKQFSITVDGVEVFSGSNPANYFTDEALWQQSVTTYGVCGKFVYDSVNNTVRLPKITGIIEGTTDENALGDLVEAGLPNITGYFNASTANSGTGTDGCFYNSGNWSEGQNYWSGINNQNNSTYRIDASRSSSIYGNSSTVQPQTIKVLYYIVVATTSKTEIQSDIDEIATDLNGKADVDLSNINASQSAKDTIIGWGMPDYANAITYTNDSTIHIAPAKGWVFVGGKANNASGVYINDVKISNTYTGSQSYSGSIQVQVPINKDDSFYATNFTTDANTVYFFAPMKGAN